MIRPVHDLPSAPPAHTFQREMRYPGGYTVTCNGVAIYEVDTAGEADEMIRYLKDRERKARQAIEPLSPKDLRSAVEALWG